MVVSNALPEIRTTGASLAVTVSWCVPWPQTPRKLHMVTTMFTTPRGKEPEGTAVGGLIAYLVLKKV